MRGRIFEVADISLCSGLQVCSPPRSSLPLRIPPQGSRGFYVRAYRAPSHAPDMLAVRIQAIDGTGTFTLSDSQPCRLLLTPPSSLLRAHVPLPLGSLLLRHSASFEESLQVVRSPCCPRELPDVISENLSLDAGSPTPAVHRVLSPVSSTMSSAFPTGKVGRLSAYALRITTSRRRVLEAADIPLCSGLQVCSPPRSFLPLRIRRRAAGAFTSGPIVLLHTHRIC